MKNLSLFFVAFFLLQLIGCKNESERDVSKNDDLIQEEQSSDIITINDIINIPTDLIVAYKIVKEENLSYSNINRRQIRISIPLGLTRQDITLNIYHSIKMTYNKYKPDGISVFVHQITDGSKFGGIIANADFAPYGKWDKIKSGVPLNKFDVNIDIQEWYFKPQEKTIKIGSNVKLSDTKWDSGRKEFVPANYVPISKSINSWFDEDIIVRVPSNANVTILDDYKERLSNGEMFIRYKVKVLYKGKTYIGWVHGDEVTQ